MDNPEEKAENQEECYCQVCVRVYNKITGGTCHIQAIISSKRDKVRHPLEWAIRRGYLENKIYFLLSFDKIPSDLAKDLMPLMGD